MKILLLNKHPVISKLVRLSAQKLDYEFDEQAHYADTLPLYDVIVVDDSVSADLKDLQNKCKKLICISSGASDFQSTPKVLHKPFLPTDLIALMKDEEKPATEQAQEASAEKSAADDTPLDLDSLSFDSFDSEVTHAEQGGETPSETQNEADKDIYLQDIKADTPENSDESANLDSLNVENSATTENFSSQMSTDTSSAIDNATENSGGFDSAGLNLSESAVQDESAGALNSADFNLGDMNLGDLDLPSADNLAENQTNEANAEMSNEGASQSVENTAENSNENSAQATEPEPKDEFSIEPIEFVETPLPTLESSTNSAESTAQSSDTNQESAQSAELTSENLAQTEATQESVGVDETAEQSANLKDSTAFNDTNSNDTNEPNFQSVPDEELAFDSKDIADIMGLDEADTQPNANAPAQDESAVQTTADTHSVADIIASAALDNAPNMAQPKSDDSETQQLLNELNEINTQEIKVDELNSALKQEEGDTAQNESAQSVDESVQSVEQNADENGEIAQTPNVVDNENLAQSSQSEVSEDLPAEKAENLANQSELNAENLATQEQNTENLPEQELNAENAEISAQEGAELSEEKAENLAEQEKQGESVNEAQNLATQEQMSDEKAENSATQEQSIDESGENVEQTNASQSANADETLQVDTNANAEQVAQSDESISADESASAQSQKADENAQTSESTKADEKAKADESENPLDLDFANALQPLNEEPFSIEEKKEGKISFDDLPENAQFLGQKSEESAEADEVRPVLLDEPKAQSTQDMVKEQLAALNAMDNEEQADDEGDEDAENAGESDLLAQLKGVSEKDLQIALGEIAPDEAQSPLAKQSENSAKTKADESAKPKESAQNAANTSASEVMDELSKGISGAITSSIKDDALKAALKGMNMHIDINIKFDEDKA